MEKIGLKSTSLPESIIHKFKSVEENASCEENIDINEEPADILQSIQ